MTNKCFRLFILLCLLHAGVHGQTWKQTQKLVPNPRHVGDKFGIDLAVTGSCAVIAAHGYDYDSVGGTFLESAGAAFVFSKDSTGNWYQEQLLVPNFRYEDMHFAATLDITLNAIIVGVPEDKYDLNYTAPLLRSGAAFIFEKDSTGSWYEKQKLIAVDRAFSNYFGADVSIQESIAAISAPLESQDTSGLSVNGAGAVYIFERNSQGNWTQVQKLFVADRQNNDRIGFEVTLHNEYLIVTSPANDIDDQGQNYLENAGAAYIFRRDSIGIWQEHQKLVSSDRDVNDNFGTSCAIDGDLIVVGAYNETENAIGTDSIYRAGSAYVFQKDSSGYWYEIQKIVASDRSSHDGFGWPIAIKDQLVLVSAKGSDTSFNSYGMGAVYVFEMNSNGMFVENQILYDSVRSNGDRFGSSIEIASDQFIIGSINNRTDQYYQNTMIAAGAFFAFESTSTTTSIYTFNSSVPLVYPNPISEKLNILCGDEQEIKTVEVFDYLGRLNSRIQNYSNYFVEMTLLGPPGTYFVRTTLSDGSTSCIRIIKL